MNTQWLLQQGDTKACSGRPWAAFFFIKMVVYHFLHSTAATAASGTSCGIGLESLEEEHRIKQADWPQRVNLKEGGLMELHTTRDMFDHFL